MYWPLLVVNLSDQEKVPQSPINECSRDGRSERGNKREWEHTPHLASNHHIKLGTLHVHKPLKYDKSNLNNIFNSSNIVKEHDIYKFTHETGFKLKYSHPSL